jgi:hypothetical protein
MRNRRAAWAISGGLHAAAVGGLWAVTRPVPETPRTDPVRECVVEMPAEPEPPSEITHSAKLIEEPTPRPSRTDSPPSGRPPVAVGVPAPLPPSVTQFVRDFGNRTASEPVRDVVDIHTPPMRDPAVVPVSGVSTAPFSPLPGSERGSRTQSLHPAGFPARSVVYVLDCSGTMGLGGRLDRARDSLRATLETLPDGVKVQVVAYSARAVPVTADGLTADRDHIVAALAKLEAAGESRHAEGLRVALLLNPDAVVLLTDAGPDELAALRPLIAGARKGVTVSVARIGDSVGVPQPLR